MTTCCAILVLTFVAGQAIAPRQQPAAADAGQQVVAGTTLMREDPPGSLELRATATAADTPVPRPTKNVLPSYPRKAKDDATEGAVTLRVTIDDSGRVREVRHLAGLDQVLLLRARLANPHLSLLGAEFVTEAIRAVREWRYEKPVNAPLAFFVQLAFTPGSESRVQWQDTRSPMQNPVAMPPMPSAVGARASGPGLMTADGQRVDLSVPGNTAPRKVKDFKPVYPQAAQKNHLGGLVILKGLIETDGHVKNVEVVTSDPMFDQSAIDAFSQWEFTPALVNGVPTATTIRVSINFTPNK